MYTRAQCEMALRNLDGFFNDIEKKHDSGEYDDWMYRKMIDFFTPMKERALKNLEQAVS